MNPFKVIENVILGPPRLVVRTLDDFHALVEIASDTNRRLGRVEDLATEMTQQLAILVKLVGVLEQGGETVIAAARRVDSVARDVMSFGDRIDAGPEALKDMGSRVEDVATQIAAEGRILQQRAKELADQGAEVAAAVPFIQRAMEAAGPSLEGALTRLGQMMAPGQPPSPRLPATTPPPSTPPVAAESPSPMPRPVSPPKAPAAKSPTTNRRPSSPKPRPATGQA